MSRSEGLRLSELLASLSLATDLDTGQPLGHALRTCLLSVSLAHEMGCEPEQVRTVHHVALLRFLGCTADAGETARMAGGDELAFNASMASVFFGGAGESLRAMVSAIAIDEPPIRRARMVASALSDPGGARRSLTSHCEVAAMLARRLGVASPVSEALAHAYERWDGKGFPAGLAGEEIPLAIRISVVARDVDVFRLRGEDPAARLRARRGKAYDPAVVDAHERLDPVVPGEEWDAVIEAEPAPAAPIEDLDRALGAMADFADLKSPWTRGHSWRVADLAAAAGNAAGLRSTATDDLRRAGLLHDLGRVGIENGVWDTPGPLSSSAWEKVRLHPYHTHRILGRCPALAPLGELAASHHERLDGTGYHRQLTGPSLTPEARLLAAADAFAALTSSRPHREAMTVEAAAEILGTEVSSGRLDGRAVSCVVEVAGGEFHRPRANNPGGLSDREVEVLALLAEGNTNRRVAELLFISPKTVGRHVENIYTKIGVSTRAAAAVYAMEHRLI